MIPASALVSLAALLAFVALFLRGKSNRLREREYALDCRHLELLAVGRLLEIRAERLGVNLKEIA
jgi:hypothetical protein